MIKCSEHTQTSAGKMEELPSKEKVTALHSRLIKMMSLESSRSSQVRTSLYMTRLLSSGLPVLT